jgi:hypothetical protein
MDFSNLTLAIALTAFEATQDETFADYCERVGVA